MSKKVSSIIIALIGLIVVIIGISLSGTEVETNQFSASGGGFDVPGAAFGADFYTYMYDASDEIVDALNDISKSNVKIVSAENYLIQKTAQNTEALYKTGGMIIVAIGLAIIAYSLPMLSAEVFNKKLTNEVNVPESCDETEEIVQEEQKN